MIDLSKPLQLTDGTPVRLVRTRADGTLVVSSVDRDVRSNGKTISNRFFTSAGRHLYGVLPDLQNVPEKKKKVYCGSLEASVILETCLQIVAVSDPLEVVFVLNKETMQDSDGDVWSFDKPAPKTTRRYINVYADQTFGRSAHATWEDAVKRSQYGKTRIAIVIETVVDGKVVYSRIWQTSPQLRTSANPNGVDPWPNGEPSVSA